MRQSPSIIYAIQDESLCLATPSGPHLRNPPPAARAIFSLSSSRSSPAPRCASGSSAISLRSTAILSSTAASPKISCCMVVTAHPRAPGTAFPTLIRLPGYPLFLALSFRLFGMENYASAVFLQIALDLAACLLIADFARLIAPEAFKIRSAHCALWLAALCPFTAIYAASPLTEGPTLFALSLALWSAARFRRHPRWATALAFTFAVTFAALLRPDGLLAAVAFAPAMLWPFRHASSAARRPHRAHRRRLPCPCARALRCVDHPQRPRLSRLSAPRAQIRHRSGRSPHPWLGPLGQNLVPRLRLHLRHRLERPRRHPRHRPAPRARL